MRASPFSTILIALAVISTAVACRKNDSAGAPSAITGELTIASGKDLPPVGPITIELREAGSGEPILTHKISGTRKSDPAGAVPFRLREVRPGRYTLGVYAEHRAPAEVIVSVSPGETATVSLRLERAEAVQGRVIDASGQPVPQARVYAWTAKWSRLPAREVASGDDGAFTIDGLAPGTISMLVQTAGLGAIQLEAVTVPSSKLLIRVDGTGQSIVGRVSHNGAGVSGAHIIIGGATLSSPRVTTSDREGRYRFAGLGAGDYDLRAWTEDLASAVAAANIENRDEKDDAKDDDDGPDEGTQRREKAAAHETPATAVHNVELFLQTGRTVGGRAIDADGKALAGVAVAIRRVPPDDCPVIVETDVVGFFTTPPLLSGRYTISANRHGFQGPPPRTIDLSGDSARLTLTLAPVAVITGRVIAPDKSPVARAEISLESAAPGATTHTPNPALYLPTDRVPVISGSLPLAAEAASLPSLSTTRVVAIQHAVTDNAGRFVLDGVSSGRFHVRVEHPKAVTAYSQEMQVSAGDRVEIGDVLLTPGGLIRGTVVDGTGAGRAEALVIVARDKTTRKRAHETVTTADGRFELRVPEGAYWIWPEKTGTIPVEPIAVDVEMNDDPEALDLRLLTAGGEVTGVVRDTEGQPLQGAHVIARLPGSAIGAQPLGATATNADGQFRLQTVPDTRLVIEAQSPSGARVSREFLPGEKQILLRFPRPGGIEGEVISTTGRYISRARVTVKDRDGREGPPVKMAGAAFEVLGLAPGPWTLVVEAPEHVTIERTVLVLAGESAKHASVTGISITLAPEP